MQAQSSNRAPEWKPGMGRVEGMAAHPSLQRRTNAELEARRDELASKLRTAEVEFAKHPDSEQVKELLDSYRQSRAAVKLALSWREVQP